MKTHIITEIFYMIMALIPAAVIYAVIILISTKLGKRKKVKKSKCIVEYLCLVYIWTISEITGIIGMQFNLQWFKESVGSIGFYLPSGRGEWMMLLLNIGLFVPLGALIPFVFKLSPLKIILGIMFFSIAIEVLQMFSGRFFEINDILANTLSGVIGYGVYAIVSKKQGKAFN